MSFDQLRYVITLDPQLLYPSPEEAIRLQEQVTEALRQDKPVVLPPGTHLHVISPDGRISGTGGYITTQEPEPTTDHESMPNAALVFQGIGCLSELAHRAVKGDGQARYEFSRLQNLARTLLKMLEGDREPQVLADDASDQNLAVRVIACLKELKIRKESGNSDAARMIGHIKEMCLFAEGEPTSPVMAKEDNQSVQSFRSGDIVKIGPKGTPMCVRSVKADKRRAFCAWPVNEYLEDGIFSFDLLTKIGHLARNDDLSVSKAFEWARSLKPGTVVRVRSTGEARTIKFVHRTEYLNSSSAVSVVCYRDGKQDGFWEERFSPLDLEPDHIAMADPTPQVLADDAPIPHVKGYSPLAAGAKWIDTGEKIDLARWEQMEKNCKPPRVKVDLDPQLLDPTPEDLARVEAKFLERQIVGKPLLTNATIVQDGKVFTGEDHLSEVASMKEGVDYQVAEADYPFAVGDTVRLKAGEEPACLAGRLMCVTHYGNGGAAVYCEFIEHGELTHRLFNPKTLELVPRLDGPRCDSIHMRWQPEDQPPTTYTDVCAAAGIEDPTDRLEQLQADLKAGKLTPDEARAAHGLPPLPLHTGDRVRLKSGGPVMEVLYVTGGTKAICSRPDFLKAQVYPLTDLERVHDTNP